MRVFVLKIRLGNEAMQTSTDIALALQEVVDEMLQTNHPGNILDVNGNIVGDYGVYFE